MFWLKGILDCFDFEFHFFLWRGFWVPVGFLDQCLFLRREGFFDFVVV